MGIDNEIKRRKRDGIEIRSGMEDELDKREMDFWGPISSCQDLSLFIMIDVGVLKLVQMDEEKK